jgi:hypothetical protein
MLTDEQISALNECIDEFQAANDKAQDHIIEWLLRQFNKSDSKAVRNVRTPLVVLSHS